MTERSEPTSTDDGAANLGNEVKLLVDLVVEHSAPWLDGVMASGHGPEANGAHPGGSSHAGEEGAAPQGTNCGWCPLCAVVNVARGERPEFSARALEQVAQLVALLRAVLADRWHPAEGVHMPGFQPEKPATPPRRREPERASGNGSRPGPRVQHIAVRKSPAQESA